ncbi:hypothetical protein BKE38_03095 [Pseudoroseomonas deserti]|uniref:Uncharacterized protein n=1 Tax=Teichococcus deserti TaxID=1817963 RepID=A0A1V2H7F3_9PROT|nr:hypothetical protein [Pseudoroseomonas deserti]ONG58326.1 hypothetical protein BKE38_03095 [Pseudoroseomonas deserti]
MPVPSPMPPLAAAPPMRGAGLRDRRPTRGDWLRFSASVVTALALAGGVALLVEREREPPVLAAHRAFAAGLRSSTMLPATSLARLPDLAGAGLTLAQSQRVAGGIYAGYRGPGRCRLGLWSGPRDGLPPRQVPGSRVALISRGGDMLWLAAGGDVDPRRFSRMAMALQLGGLPEDALCPE